MMRKRMTQTWKMESGAYTRSFLTACVLAFLLFLPGAARADSPSEIGAMLDKRCQRLTRGINLSHWFAQTRLTKERFLTYNTPEDARLIREMGFRHVRFPLDPRVLLDEKTPEKLHPEHLKMLDDAISFLLAEDLAVIVDIHPSDEFKAKLDEEEGFVDVFAAFWRALAAHLSPLDPEKVFLEIINESKVKDADKWFRIATRLAAAMREGAPRHTLIVTGAEWSGIDRLVQLTPLSDPNAVYTFHFYEPFNFTHQGAGWGWEGWREMHDIPYPSTEENVKAILPKLATERAKKTAAWHGKENWNRDKIAGRIREASAWAKKHNARLYCGEFGVYRKCAPTGDRLTWIRDVRSILEEEGIGWSMWDYARDFGVVVEKDGKRVPDTGTLQALGLMEGKTKGE